MSVADELKKTKQYLQDAYATIEEKGGEMPEQKNMQNLSPAIESVKGGGSFGYLLYQAEGEEEEERIELDFNDVLQLIGSRSSWRGEQAYVLKIGDRTLDCRYVTGYDSGDDLEVIPRGIFGSLGDEMGSSDVWTAFVKIRLGKKVRIVSDNAFSALGYYAPFATLEIDESPLEEIGSSFLTGCARFNSPITIPNTVKRIGSNAFSNWESFDSSFTFEEGHYIEYIGNGAFSNWYTFNQPFEYPNGSYIDASEEERAKAMETGGWYNYSIFSYWQNFNQPITIPNNWVAIPETFMANSSVFDQEITIPASVKKIYSNFLNYAQAFNHPVIIPDTVEYIDTQGFLSGCDNFNSELRLPDGAITTLEYGFMNSLGSFNQPFNIPEGVETIGTQVFTNNYSFNSPITLPSTLKSIGGSFMTNCTSFNQPLVVPEGVQTIGNNFLASCSNLASNVTIPSTVTSIDTYFLSGCDNFTGLLIVNTPNAPTDNYSLATRTSTSVPMYKDGVNMRGEHASTWMSKLPNRTSTPYRKLVQFADTPYVRYTDTSGSVVEVRDTAGLQNVIGQSSTSPSVRFTRIEFLPEMKNFKITSLPYNSSYFLYNQTSLTEITGWENLPDSITTIGNNFMYGCSAYTGPVTLPNSVTQIGDGFMYGCTAYTGSISLPDGVQQIGNNFLYNCSKLTGEVSIGNSTTSIGSNFMYGCTQFSSPIVLPSSLTAIGGYFMYNCNNFVGPLTVDSPGYPTDNYSLSTANSSVPMYAQGVIIKGEYLGEWADALPDRTSSPYRKIYGQGGEPYVILTDLNGNTKGVYSKATFLNTWCKTGEYNVVSVEYQPKVSELEEITELPYAGGGGFLTNMGTATEITGLEYFTHLTKIGNNFMRGRGVFNGTLPSLDNITSIGDNFMYGCTSFSQPITIPASVESVGNIFMYDCPKFTGPLTVNTDAHPTDEQSLSVWYSTAGAISRTVRVRGSGIVTWLNALPKLYVSSISYARDLLIDETSSFYAAIRPGASYQFFTDKDSFISWLSDDAASCRSATWFGEKIESLTEITRLPYREDATTFLGDANYTSSAVVEGLEHFTHLTEVGNGFLYNRTNFDGELPDLSKVTKIGNNFLRGCELFNQPITIPATVDSIGAYFMNTCNSFTNILTVDTLKTPANSNYALVTSDASAPIYATGVHMEGLGASTWKEALPDSYINPYRRLFVGEPTEDCYVIWVNSAGTHKMTDKGQFLDYVCSGREAELKISPSSGLKSIEFTPLVSTITELTQLPYAESATSFLKSSTNDITGLEYFTHLTKIGDNFLMATKFDSPLPDMSQVTSIGQWFLDSCSSFNQRVELPLVTDVSHEFMSGASSFNQPLVMPKLTSTKGGFLKNCSSFNQPLSLPMLETTEGSFMAGCSSFNSTIELPRLSSTGGYFMQYCRKFNQPLPLPSLTVISFRFMDQCEAFNQPIDLSRVTEIGSEFMFQCKGFAQPLTLGENVTRIGERFMSNCDSFMGPLNVGNAPAPNSTQYLYDALATVTETAPMYVEGVTLTGANASAWKKAFPDRTTSPYRKLIVANS